MGKSSNTREEKKDLLPAAAAAAAAASTIRVEHEPASLTQSAAESTSRVDPEPSLTPSAAALGRPKWSPLPAPRPLILLYVGITEDGGGGAELSVEKEFDVMEQAWNQTLRMQQKCLQFIRRYFSRPADLVECIMQYRPSILHVGYHGTEEGFNLAFNSFVTHHQLADALESLNRDRTSVQLIVANACWSSVAS